MKVIGTFNVRGKKMRVSDPCYDPDPGHETMVAVVDAKDGEWIASIATDKIPGWGERVVELLVQNSDSVIYTANIPWVMVNEEIGVDSGQCGFWNEADYARGVRSRYDEVCALTCSAESAGILKDYGAVSSSGFGDGGYRLDTKTIDGKVVAARLTFIVEDQDPEDEEDETDV